MDVAGQDAALPAGILVGRDGAERDSTVVTVAWTGAAMTTAHHALAQLLGETFRCMRIAGGSDRHRG